MLGNTRFLQQKKPVSGKCVKCHCRESAPKSVNAYVTELLKSVSQSVQVERAGGGVCEEGEGGVRNGPPEESREGSGAEEAVALLQRRNLPSSSSTALSATCRPFFLRRDARITFPWRGVRACVCVFSQ